MKTTLTLAAAALTTALAFPAQADSCADLAKAGLTYSALKSTLETIVPGNNGGLNFPMWLTLVDGSGTVCSITNSLTGSQTATADIWLGSRVISAQKASTANAFSTSAFALSTANLFSAVQPGGSLFGLQESNPVNALFAYLGSETTFGTPHDPLTGIRIGGINVFGGGLALYLKDSAEPSGTRKVGALGVSGDTSCTDHVVAWKVRSAFEAKGIVTAVPAGVSAAGSDQMVFDITPNPAGGTGISAGGFGHPGCLNNPTAANAGGANDFEGGK